MDRRAQLMSVFVDTQEFYTSNAVLAAAVEASRKRTKLYATDDYPELPIQGTKESLLAMADDADGSLSASAAAYENYKRLEAGAPSDTKKHLSRVTLSKEKTFESAMRLHKQYPDKKIAVLNSASATRPGGGVKTGSSAQEESLSRCSTLFPTLDRKWLWEKYYDVNRAAKDVLHTDACIYSPGVVICKTDERIPQRMKQEDWVTVDVISCAAPNLRNEPANIQNPETGKAVRMDPIRLFELHMKRAEHILTIAAANDVDVLVLGAFGCGAFCNDPTIVAKAYYSAASRFRSRFDEIAFAIYCRDFETENYDAFAQALRVIL